MYSTSNIIIIIIVFIRVIDMQIYDKKAIIHLTQLWTPNGQGTNGNRRTMQGTFPYLTLMAVFHVNRTAVDTWKYWWRTASLCHY